MVQTEIKNIEKDQNICLTIIPEMSYQRGHNASSGDQQFLKESPNQKTQT